MRHFLLPLALACASLAGAASAGTPATPPAAPPAPVFVLSGGGWGHGVGMSQWGAYGQARAGRDYRTILKHYYSGVELATAAPTPPRVRVLVGQGVQQVAISSSKRFDVVDGAGKTWPLQAGSIEVGPGLRLPVGKQGKQVVLTGPLLFRPGKHGTLSAGDTGYRGELRVDEIDGRLELVNVVGLETYLLGVVPGEMPKDWPLEALKAQAVAARTYAVARLVNGRSYDLTSDWSSQVYYGIAREAPGPTRAVRETKGEILTYGGAPITAFYSSSSGGRTASAADVFGSAVPYLQAVDDPWDEFSPNHRWAPTAFGPAALARALGVTGPVVDAAVVAGAAGRPAALRVTTVSGSAVELRVTDVRAKLGLRSSSFRIGILRLDRVVGPVKAGTKLKLTGLARHVDGVLLERLIDGVWKPSANLVLDANGAFSVDLRPTELATYRLAAPGLVGPALTVRVVGSAA
ncbi:MAG: SpoIID/LytB domain-containing protein [Gaiella sp.]